jgi:acetyl-CoA carboxylase biotin carboxyl carrier protein
MKLPEIQDLIKFVAKAGVSEVEIEQKDFKITIKTENHKKKSEEHIMMMPQMPMYQQQQMPAPAPAPQLPAAAPAPAAATSAPAEDSKLITIKSPMIGTFYRKPSPDKPNFVEVGTSIKAGDVICIVEAMKLFNEIEAEISGKVVKVLVDDMSPIEYDQPLFLVEPN